MKKPSNRLIAVFVTTLVVCLVLVVFLVLRAQAPVSPIHAGMTANQVTATMGLADRILNHQEVDGVHPNATVVWYYNLPRRPQDFDSHMLVVEIDQHNKVLEVYEISN